MVSSALFALLLGLVVHTAAVKSPTVSGIANEAHYEKTHKPTLRPVPESCDDPTEENSGYISIEEYDKAMSMPSDKPEDVKVREDGTHADFIVVGAGAGGGTAAARLAQAGYKVLVIEAGPAGEFDPVISSAPNLFAQAAEDPTISLDYYVEHLNKTAADEMDWKYWPNIHNNEKTPSDVYYDYPDYHKVDEKKVLYPRGYGLGGSTLVNAMIAVNAFDKDWDRTAQRTGRPELWNSKRMRQLFENKLERNLYMLSDTMKEFEALDKKNTDNTFREEQHGYCGWLATTVLNVTDQYEGFTKKSGDNSGSAANSAYFTTPYVAGSPEGSAGPFEPIGIWNGGDINSELKNGGQKSGGQLVPSSVFLGRRSIVAYRLQYVRLQMPENLILLGDSTATEIIFDETSELPKASGVKVAHGKYLSSASKNYNAYEAEAVMRKTVTYKAKYETIIAANTFETPKLLMHSGIGPKDKLRSLGIRTKVDSPGVGQNVQDRNEISLITGPETINTTRTFYRNRCSFNISRMDDPHEPCFVDFKGFSDELSAGEVETGGPPGNDLKGVVSPDPLVREGGQYSSTGLAVSAFTTNQNPPLPGVPDNYHFGGGIWYEGYRPGFGETISASLAANAGFYARRGLQAYSNSRGWIEVNSANPQDAPGANMNKFSDPGNRDMERLKDVFRQLRAFEDAAIAPGNKEFVPGEDLVPKDKPLGKEFEDWGKQAAWGHHICCSAPMGANTVVGQGELPAVTGVLDGDLRVKGVMNLRVGDASAFPDIPGHFLMVPTLLLGENLAQMLIDEYQDGAKLDGHTENINKHMGIVNMLDEHAAQAVEQHKEEQEEQVETVQDVVRDKLNDDTITADQIKQIKLTGEDKISSEVEDSRSRETFSTLFDAILKLTSES